MSRLITNGLAEGNNPEFCLVKAWCALSYIIDPTVRFYKSNGFSSVLDRGAGSWEIESNNAFPDTNRVAVFGGERNGRRTIEGMITIMVQQTTTKEFSIRSFDNDTNGAGNPDYLTMSVI